MQTIPRIHPARVLLAGLLALGLALGGLAQDVAYAQPPWSDNFDSYLAGSQMIGQGGWTGWDNNPAVGALVSNAFARSSPNSVAVTGPTDLVHTYSGYTSGRAVYTAWQYIPNTFSGTTYFILLNQYNVGGAKNWSVQVHFESASGRVISDFDGGSLALIRGRWVQIRVEINLDTDTQTFYYDNIPLYTKSWRCGVSGCGPLPPNVAAVDLYANGASPVYYDDMSLDHAAPALTLAKSITSGNPYSTVGSLIGYSYLLTNTGNVALFAPYSVVDDKATPTCPAGPASLAPGGTVTCTASHTVTQADLDAGSVTNTATATARDAAVGGNAVTSNSSSQTATATQSPALSIAKSAVPATYSSVGQVISYGYVVANSGNVTLSGPFTVSDDKATDESCPLTPSLAPTASITCTASYTIIQADLDAGSVMNTATATNGGVTSAPDSEIVTAVQSPALTIVKTALPATYSSVGQIISYSYLVTNSGNVTLSGPFTVADNRATDEACPATPSLAPTVSVTCTASYTITQADLDAGSVTNTATATTGTVTSPPDSETANASQTTGLTLTKSITSGSPYSSIGDVIQYSYDVENTGNVTLDGPFTVLDDRSTDETCPATVSLVPATSITCIASHTVTAPDLAAGSVTNSAYATGSFSGSPVTSNTDQATAVAVSDPAVTKSAYPATVQIGDTVTITLAVTNTGPGSADNVTLTDPIPAFLDIVLPVTVVPVGPTVTVVGNNITVDLGTLPPAATYTVTITTVVNSLGAPPGGTNLATVTTSSADSDPGNNASSALVTIVSPAGPAPATGFAPGRTTILPDQPADLAFIDYGGLWIEIPALGVRLPIVGVPLTEDGWDVTWLGSQAGYLNGTAFPTWKGNSVITSHVTLASGRAGPFRRLGNLDWDDQVVIHYSGQRYVYSVRTTSAATANDASIFRHEERPWLTLVTCGEYDSHLGEYRSRIVVKAVLTSIELEP